MSEPILNIKQLNARVEEKEILHDINLQIRKGETHVLMGPNGAGKSTLGYVLMGNPNNNNCMINSPQEKNNASTSPALSSLQSLFPRLS